MDPVLHWELALVTHLYRRRYLLRQTGLELYITTGERFFFAFRTRKERDDVVELLLCEVPRLARCDRADDVEEMMRKWQRPTTRT